MWIIDIQSLLAPSAAVETVVSLAARLGMINQDIGWATRVLAMALASMLLLVALLVIVNRRDRRLYAALAESTAQQQTLISNLPGVAFRCRDDDVGTVFFISDEIERLSGYPASDFVGGNMRRLMDIVHPKEWETVMASFRQGATTGRPFELDSRLRHGNGTYVWVHIKGRGSFDSHGRLRWIDGVMIDITQRHQAEADRERLTTAIEQADEIILITDVAGVILYVNPAFERVTGYTREEAIGQTPRLLKSGQQTEAFYNDMWHTLVSGKVWKGRIVNKRKDGSLYTEAANITPVRDENGDTVNYVAAKRDITKEIELEEQRQQAQKMESVGRLAGGVAHGFNNMLQAILGHTEIAERKVSAGEPLEGDLEAIRDAAQRSTDLTRQLLTFGRKQTINPEVLNLNQAVANTLKMLPEILGKNVSIVWQPAKTLWRVAMDPVQVDQVLMNLCVNARDAFDGSGTITIASRNVHLTDADIKERTQRGPGDYVALSVSDDGCGMDASTIAHLFEPFFTTKQQGRGTGMGLATVYGVLQQNHGFIDVASEPGRGSVFTFYLPRLLTAELDEPAAMLADGAKAKSSAVPETILLVDDEPAALHVCRVMLEGQGYRVLAAATGAEAMRVAEENDGEIDLLLTDVIMPETNGYELAQQLQAKWPAIKCMFMSGYTADIIVRRGVVEDGLQFVQKPFASAVLIARVRATLGQNVIKVPVHE